MNDSAKLFHDEEEQPLTLSKNSPAKCRRKRPPKKCLTLDEPSLGDDHSDHSVQLESGDKNKVWLRQMESYSDAYHMYWYIEHFKFSKWYLVGVLVLCI